MKIAYWIGKISKRFRLWYWRTHGHRWWWGIHKFLDDKIPGNWYDLEN